MKGLFQLSTVTYNYGEVLVLGDLKTAWLPNFMHVFMHAFGLNFADNMHCYNYCSKEYVAILMYLLFCCYVPGIQRGRTPSFVSCQEMEQCQPWLASLSKALGFLPHTRMDSKRTLSPMLWCWGDSCWSLGLCLPNPGWGPAPFP